jgi:plastocyanin
MKIITPLLTSCLLALTACGGSESAAPAATNTVVATTDPASIEATVVEIMNSRFSDPELRVSVGTTVRFINRDVYAHTVTSTEGSAASFDSGGLGLDATFDVTFDDAGEFAYFCQIHPTMRGVVIVE